MSVDVLAELCAILTKPNTAYSPGHTSAQIDAAAAIRSVAPAVGKQRKAADEFLAEVVANGALNITERVKAARILLGVAP